MPTLLSRNRSLSDVADTDEYNRLQVRRAERPRGTAPVDVLCRRLRVLIVDDHRASADTLAMLIRLWGHDVRRVYDGDAGLALAAEFVPDVLFLDLVMPGMSGQQLAIKVEQHAKLQDCVMIAITGSTDELRRQFCPFAGISAVLVKPVLPSVVQSLLASEFEHLRRARRVPIISAPPTTEKQPTGVRSSGRASSTRGVGQGTAVT